MNSKKMSLITLLSMALFVFTACEDEKAEETPEYGSISGQVTFNGEFPPADSGAVRISVNTNWYPTGPPYSYKEIPSSEVINNIYEFEFKQVAFGTYKAIAVDYVAASNTTGAYDIWGVYGGTLQADFMDASSVVVNIDNPDVNGVDIEVTIY